MFIVLLSLLSFSLLSVSAQEECPIQYSCNNTNFNESLVEKYCKSHDSLMSGRCCILNETVIGLDLRYCNIKTLNISQHVFEQVEILDLRENDYEKLTSDELINLLNLNYLYLPEHIPCPGGHMAWNITEKDHNMTSCLDQLNSCNSLNISCGEPDDANCHHLGPGTAKCICQPGHFGYKCLNEGEFPVVIFSSSVVFPTIVLSIALWFIQGRDPYKTREI
ncbi:All-trans retinoic acid-induced differentiation factor [Araneus ventricosus]|uniref:All-trans retinoic acid-induced differentiation factor n=1 Tax=Araneus ventricosus TaxID=182803 RepID=A0A4Y2EP16_ARAVE|nr:All-trans retinoic acid-induced differentiation factor [Araneus ventricosus]